MPKKCTCREGQTPNAKAVDHARNPKAIAIAKSAQRLDELRGKWLNPADIVYKVAEVVPGFPDCILPKNEKAASELTKHTLTNLYNQRPKWLDDAHRELDTAVAAAAAAAYGWPADISEEGALARLLELNLERKSAHPAKLSVDEEDEAESE